VLLPHFQVIVEFLCAVVAYDERIFGQLLEETFWCCAVDEEVEGLYWDEQSTQ
jgi:hypothetical protein